MLLACFWLAAKLKQARKKLPVVAKVAALLGMSAYRLNYLEVRLLDVLEWAPLRGWKDPYHPRQARHSDPVPEHLPLTPKLLHQAMLNIIYDVWRP